MTGLQRPAEACTRFAAYLCLGGASLSLGACDGPAVEAQSRIVIVPAPRSATVAALHPSHPIVVAPSVNSAASPPSSTFTVRPDLAAAIADDGGLRPLPAELIQPRPSTVKPDRRAWEAELSRVGLQPHVE